MTWAAIEWMEWLAANPHLVEEGNNRGPVAELLMRGDKGLPWCAAGVLIPLRCAGHDIDYWTNRNVRTFEAWCERHSKLLPRSQDPHRGDVVFFHNRDGSDSGTGGHVGMVARIAGNTIITLEGNLADGWGSRSFPFRDVRISSYARF